MSKELPESLRDSKTVLERGSMLNQLMTQRDAAWEALRRIAALNPEDYFANGDAVKIARKAQREPIMSEELC